MPNPAYQQVAKVIVDKAGNLSEAERNALKGLLDGFEDQPQLSFPSYSVTVNYDQTVEQLVKNGKYDWFNTNITTSHFPLGTTGKAKKYIILLPIDQYMGTEAVLKLIDQFAGGKYRRPNIKEGLALGAHLNLQREATIAILCEPWCDSVGGSNVPFLYGGSTRRLNLLYLPAGVWGSHWHFVAVRK